MSKNKLVLGRGLDALIRPSSDGDNGVESSVNDELNVVREVVNAQPQQVSEANFLKIKLSQIAPNPFQPRTNFDPQALEELKNSIIVNGLIQPITVRRMAPERFQLISGERRFKAFTELGFSEIPAYILDVVSDETMLAMALIENIQREQLNPIEVGVAYQRLLEECSLTHEEIAQRVGKDRSTVTNSIRLLKLPQKIQDSLIKGDISMGHARALVNVPDVGRQLAILELIVSQNLSVRKVEELVKKAVLADSAKSHVKKAAPEQATGNPAYAQFEDQLRRLLGTKVMCKQKSGGAGEIVIEYYSQGEFERLLELLYAIQNT
jgi:ParB family chromosome partitioning protein